MLFMGVSVPDAANVCNESKVESYDTDIKYCPEFYAENEKENTTESDSDINSDILEDDSVIGSLNEITKDKSDVTFYDIYESLKSGDVDSTIDMALKVFSNSVIYEVRTSRGLALQIIAVIVLGSTFAQLAGNMGEYVSAHGFMVTYMVLLSLLLGDFVLVQSIVQDTIGDVTEFMKAFYPMYASSVLYVSGPESAGYSQSVIILVIYICQNVIIKFILPLIKCGGLIALINNLGSEDYFSRMAGLMKSLAVWGMRTMFAVVTGINVVKSMIAPSMDRLSRNGILRTLGKGAGMSTVSAVISVMVNRRVYQKLYGDGVYDHDSHTGRSANDQDNRHHVHIKVHRRGGAAGRRQKICRGSRHHGGDSGADAEGVRNKRDDVHHKHSPDVGEHIIERMEDVHAC